MIESKPTLQRHMLRVVRLLWSVLLLGQVFLIAVVTFLRGHHALELPSESDGRTIFLIAAIGLPICAALGYHFRNQIYKRHWQGQVITPQGYFTGNQVLFMLCMADSTVGLVSILVGGQWWPGILPTLVVAAIMAVNFPNGKAMEPAEPAWTTQRRQ